MAYPISLINDDIIDISIIKNVNKYLGILLKCLLVNISINPVPSAIDKPINDISNVPNGAKLKKFFAELLIINFRPSNVNKFSTVKRIGSNSFVLTFIVLYVACICNNDKNPLKIITKNVNTINIVIG